MHEVEQEASSTTIVGKYILSHATYICFLTPELFFFLIANIYAMLEIPNWFMLGHQLVIH